MTTWPALLWACVRLHVMLQLMAAVTATRLTEFVCSSLPHDRQAVRVYFWTDSQIVLHWCKGINPKPFISHRVKEIHGTFPTAPWSFTPSVVHMYQAKNIHYNVVKLFRTLNVIHSVHQNLPKPHNGLKHKLYNFLSHLQLHEMINL